MVVTVSPSMQVAWEGVGVDVKGRAVWKIKTKLGLGRRAGNEQKQQVENEVGHSCALERIGGACGGARD